MGAGPDEPRYRHVLPGQRHRWAGQVRRVGWPPWVHLAGGVAQPSTGGWLRASSLLFARGGRLDLTAHVGVALASLGTRAA
eukprot:scaffold2480_cov385-Prasinococcus_capsulatus_cf.AAC.3